MITVLGRATSANVQTVMWAIAEIGLPYERIDIGASFGGNNTPEYLAMNPNGLVPVIKDGDVTLFESAAIVRYLGAKYASEPFWPADPARRGPLDMWAEWTKTTFVPAIVPLFMQLIRMKEADRNAGAIASANKELIRVAAIADKRIGDGPYLAGDELTFADIVFAHQLYRYNTLPIERGETPNLDAYSARLSQRPAYAEHVMVSYESLRAK